MCKNEQEGIEGKYAGGLFEKSTPAPLQKTFGKVDV